MNYNNLTKSELIELLNEKSINEKFATDNSNSARLSMQRVINKSKCDWQQEHFVVTFLNAKLKEIDTQIVFIGHQTASIVSAKEIFRRALKMNANSIIVGHNHPTLDVSPSENDNKVTTNLIEVGKMIGIPVHDHIIFTKFDEIYSYKEKSSLF